MFPIPNLQLAGGAGGDAGDAQSRGSSSFAPAFGGFAVGGQGNTAAGGTASASASDNSMPAWLLPVGIGAGALVLLVIVARMRRG